MHIVITDSGLGGFSVCAKLVFLLKEAKFKNSGFSDLIITYINAAPSNEMGYNDMSNKSEQILTFKKTLNNIEKLYYPDLIFVACGTLSGLLEELNIFEKLRKKIIGIVPIGTKMILDSLKKNSNEKTIIFGTPTTIRTNVFQKQLLQNGINKKRISSQECPELASNITNDIEGIKVSKIIRNFVKKSLKKNSFRLDEQLHIFLGCTHFAYRENFFYDSFGLEGYKNINILNPNNACALYLKNFIFLEEREIVSDNNKKISIKFVSPYIIPEQEKKTITKLILPVSVEASIALQNNIICPDLIKD